LGIFNFYKKMGELNFEQIDGLHTRFKHPFTMTVSGSTGAGKSEWIRRLLANLPQMVEGEIGAVIYCYGEVNANVLAMQRKGKVGEGHVSVQVHSGLPSEELVRTQAKEWGGRLLVVLDDLMVGMQQELLDILFTRGSHNWSVSCVLVTQHLFSKELRVARNNSHYLVLMRNPAGALQIRTLASQLFPSRTAYFMEAYADACKQNFGYLLVDMHPLTPDQLRLRTHIYPDDGECIVYAAK
jgi:hypothetical protein